jgi:hypothetical protein
MFAAILSLPVSSYAFGTNPQKPFAGAPGQGTCASCHGTLTTPSGILVNAPKSYTPGGAAIPMTVTIPASGGFELEVGTQASNVMAGVLAAGDTNGAVLTVGGIQFFDSVAETTSWNFTWTPPATNVGNVVLYVTGGTHGTNYSNSFVMTPAASTPAPSITSFSAASPSITAGNSTTLTAVFSNGTGMIDNGVGSVTSGTPVIVKPTVTTTYTLTVSGTGTAATSKVTVTVTPATLQPSISSFVAGSPSITAGGSTTLTAVFSNGTGNINNGVGAVTSGTPVTIIPSATTTYTLTVTGTGTPATANATVTVNPSTGTGTLSATPSSLSFAYQMGGSLPSSQKLTINSTGGTTSFTLTETDPWLSVTPTSGTGTPATLAASLNSAGLAGLTVGSHGAQINITAGGKTLTVSVALTITAASSGGGGTSGNMTAQAYVSDTQSGALAAAWVNNLGNSPHDSSDPLNRALVLSKGASAPHNAWAGAIIQNVNGMSLTEVGFDFNASIQCSTNTVHFIITTTDGTSHTLGGCTSSLTSTQSTAPTGWMRLRFDPSKASPAISPSEHVQSISIEVGNGSSSTGSIAVIDNITINGTLTGKGSSTSNPRPRDD